MYEVKSQSHLPNSVTTPPNSQNNVFHLRGIHYFLCIENIAHVHAQTQYLFFYKNEVISYCTTTLFHVSIHRLILCFLMAAEYYMDVL